MGDAAHPMLPYLAQGGVLALEDALVLADCLAARPATRQAPSTPSRPSAARRAERVQAISRRQGRIYHLSPPLSWARDARPAPRPRALADGGLRLALRLESRRRVVAPAGRSAGKRCCAACCNSAVRPAHSGRIVGYPTALARPAKPLSGRALVRHEPSPYCPATVRPCKPKPQVRRPRNSSATDFPGGRTASALRRLPDACADGETRKHGPRDGLPDATQRQFSRSPGSQDARGERRARVRDRRRDNPDLCRAARSGRTRRGGVEGARR